MLIIYWLVLAVLVGVYARSKGHSGLGYLLLAVLLTPLIGFIIALIVSPIKSKTDQIALNSGEMKKCPFCAELVRFEAKKCRYCNSELIETTVEDDSQEELMEKYNIQWNSSKNVYLYKNEKFKNFDYALHIAMGDKQE
ncbi:hypothetical protein [Thalassomonas actiniarum]|uniref:Zinc ribbon domain-containing protein n=1 Tax=Thalassomonas actiniarum TaxID=485447 RepID=A0AAE9YSC5_9GAMM|nr:hypothetical protein [Thalassomonas actiniarum]WDE00340.1 hypothetical protein SG35_006775 [Thalassomonas actiniarum]